MERKLYLKWKPGPANDETKALKRKIKASRFPMERKLSQGFKQGPARNPRGDGQERAERAQSADLARPFRIVTDGCVDSGGVGAILEQEDPDAPGQFRPVAYTSKALLVSRTWDVSRIEYRVLECVVADECLSRIQGCLSTSTRSSCNYSYWE